MLFCLPQLFVSLFSTFLFMQSVCLAYVKMFEMWLSLTYCHSFNCERLALAPLTFLSLNTSGMQGLCGIRKLDGRGVMGLLPFGMSRSGMFLIGRFTPSWLFRLFDDCHNCLFVCWFVYSVFRMLKVQLMT